METEIVVNLAINGEQPPINDRIKSSKHPVDQGLRQAIKMCFIHDPKERPSARVVSDFLTDLTGVLAIDTKNENVAYWLAQLALIAYDLWIL